MGKPAQARSQPSTARYLAAIVAALPKGVSFLDWYNNCDESDFVGTRTVKREARSAWDVLLGMSEAYDLTVRELLEADEIDLGPESEE